MDDKKHISVIRAISEDEYNQISEIIKDMERIEFIHSAKAPLVENYQEIMNLVESYINNKSQPIIFKYYIVIRVQNFLSSVRGFIDTFAHTLSDEYGKDSDIYNEFKQLKSKMYDKHFSYRFIETLRNYSQHRALPITSLNFSSENHKKVVRVIIKKEKLLSDSKISGKMKEDIRLNCSDEIDLLPHLSTMFGSIIMIHDEMMKSVIKEDKCEAFFGFEKEFIGSQGSPLLLDYDIFNDGENLTLHPRLFNFDGIRRISEELEDTKKFMQSISAAQGADVLSASE